MQLIASMLRRFSQQRRTGSSSSAIPLYMCLLVHDLQTTDRSHTASSAVWPWRFSTLVTHTPWQKRMATYRNL